jgi:dipeptidyl aminopeptidase/acylaminoacyl peptidase
MITQHNAPYGSWKSPITSDLIVAGTIGIGEIRLDGDDVYWNESRPTEGGRSVIVKRTPDGQIQDVTPMPFNVRSRVHEYGGGAYLVHQGVVYFSNFADQRLYRQQSGQTPEPVSPEGKFRYADGVMDAQRRSIICVREDHTGAGEAVNTVVRVSLENGETQILVSGSDFYSSPRLSPDGTQLVWFCWNHPCMPWDGTELWVATLNGDGTIATSQKIAGGTTESICQPEWSPAGVLHFISDRTGWWNLYRCPRLSAIEVSAIEIEPLCPMEAEFGYPHWGFGGSMYHFASATQIICTYSKDGTSYLASLDTTTKQLERISLPYSDAGSIHIAAGKVVLRVSSPTQPSAIAQLDLATHHFDVLRKSSELTLDPGYVSVPDAIAFPTSDGQTAYGFYYAPKNKDFAAPASERPPLLVKSHGGPTGSTSTLFNLKIQYWTSRGFAVLDVDYRGSTGYGRAYRELLKGRWGIADVEDCVNGATYLVTARKVDGDRLVIDGGSAGGYTTLCALTFYNTFKAGASFYGVSDLEVLATDTHKFESRYLDSLIGAYPQQKEIYMARSPIHFSNKLSCPVIFFQGDEDKIVPPNQAERMVEVLRNKGVPVAYVLYAGEQHGFRKAENIKRTLDGEFYFYSQVFGFAMADPVEPVAIENL